MNSIIDFATRNIILIGSILLILIIMGFNQSLMNTVLLVLAIEFIAIALSSMAAFLFTKLDFVNTQYQNVLGYIFLGVHICVGLAVLGVYIVQFSL